MVKFSRFGRPILYVLIALFILPALLSTTAPQVAAAGWPGGYGYRLKITIDHTKVDSDLDNFPVLIYLDSSYTEFWTHCDSEQNIAFTSSDGMTQLKREVELFDHTNDNFYAYVKVPNLSSTVDTDIYIYYDSVGHGNTNDADTWDDNFVMVQHMTDKTTSTIEDSTSNNNDGTKGTANQPLETDGKIVKAQDFSAGDYYITTSSPSGVGVDYSVEVWIKRDGTPAAVEAFLHQDWDGVNQPYPFELRFLTSGVVVWYLRDPTSRLLTGTTNICDNTWHRITIVRDSSGTGYIYLDGNEHISGGMGTGNTSSSQIIDIGRHATPGNYYGGGLDEIRISNVIRSAGWILTTFNNQSSPSTFYTVGAEETSGFPAVSSIACDNILLDRDVDWASGVVTGTKLQADVEFETGKLVVKENVRFVIYDKLDAVIDNKQATDNLKLADNKQRFFVTYSALDNTLANNQMGGWDVKVEAYDDEGTYADSCFHNVFYVCDLDTTRNVEDLIKHRIRTYGTVSRVDGGTLVGLESVTIIDNMMGTFYGELSGNDWENIRAPSEAGKFYLKLKAENLDGIDVDNLDYAFPNFAPEIVSISVDNSLIDRDEDYAGSGADTDTVITVRLRDNDTTSDFQDAWVAVRDILDAVIDNENVFSTATVVDENQIDITMTYEATDNTLANNQLGAWDVWAYVADIYDNEDSGWQTSKFTVDDLTSTINFNPAVPYIGWDLTVSGTHSRVSGGAISIDASWLIDNKHGQFALGASNTYDNTYTISNATLEENISVTLRVRDSPLDGVTVSSYKTNENVKFQVEVRFEENYEIIQWIPNENRAVEMLFEWDGGTHPYTLTSNPENITVPVGGIATKIVKITDNDAYWRYVIPEFSGGTLTFVLVDDPETVEQYRFFLQDYTGLYTPPDGQLLIKSWVGTNLAGINADFWGADWRTTAWLVTGTQYQMWVRAPSAALRLVGPIDAVVPSEEKTIIVQVVISELDPIFDHVYWAAWRESDAIIRVEYQDNLDNTIEAHVGIYDMDGDLMSQYQPDNEWFIVTWPYAENTESYEVVLTVQHGIYGNFTRNVPIGLMEGPPGVPGGISDPFGLPAGVTLAAIGSVILTFILGLSFDALRVQLGVLAMALTTLFCWYMGFLPLPGPYDGAFTATLILVAAVLFALTWRRGK